MEVEVGLPGKVNLDLEVKNSAVTVSEKIEAEEFRLITTEGGSFKGSKLRCTQVHTIGTCLAVASFSLPPCFRSCLWKNTAMLKLRRTVLRDATF